MASLVRNMLRSSSSMREEPDSRPSSLPRSESNMQSSHSFNDLSLGTSRDAEHEYTGAARPVAIAPRASVDNSVLSGGSSLSSRSSMETSDFSSHLKRISAAFGSPLSGAPTQPCSPQAQPMDISEAGSCKSQELLASQTSCPADQGNYKNQRRRPGKIDGLDYYDWNDMLRSSSL